MRQRTKSVVNVREYFRMDGSGAPEQEDDDDNDGDWKRLLAALHGVPVGGRGRRSSSKSGKAFNVIAPESKKSARGRTSTCDSLDDTDDDTDDETDDDADDDGILRVRACSHDRRISFHADVDVVEIPARSSFDAEYKQRVWYSRDELRRSQTCC
ncbi:unnamed protein product [Hyaloperonospora brassicae]|uniref:RxLR effector candidate protein n=1 Tax=Hyaloperonospora brassicae TaxID=162125 RepID=A0AAV0U9H1_HYABA|nr:unnamed protein product [Hyaloperonospora brassicae]